MYQVWRKRLLSLSNFNILYYSALILAVAVIVYGGIKIIKTPYAGFFWAFSSGEIYQIDPDTKATGLLSINDKVLAVNGLGPKEGMVFPGQQIGDSKEVSSG
jgi:hypothetical protein